MATWCSMKLAQTKATGLTAAIVRRSTWQKTVWGLITEAERKLPALIRLMDHHRPDDPFDGLPEARSLRGIVDSYGSATRAARARARSHALRVRLEECPVCQAGPLC